MKNDKKQEVRGMRQGLTSNKPSLLGGRNARVAVGMSGGVDSSLAAALLVEQGYEVTGVFLECFRAPGCRVDEDRKDAMDVAMKLKIPFQVLDFKKEYREKVVDYFYAEYEKGRTPNPDVMCNKEIKFGMFYEWAINAKFDYVATGHYGRIRKLKTQNSKLKTTTQKSKVKYQLMRGVDEHKDQSYFLYQLREEQLPHILFPLGEMTKKEVREEARKRGLGVADKPDSQGICFVGEVKVDEFLESLGMKEEVGNVVMRIDDSRKVRNPKSKIQNNIEILNSNSEIVSDLEISALGLEDNYVVVGRHIGAWFYTIGQRVGVANEQQTTNSKLETKWRRIYRQNLMKVGLDPSNLPPLYVVEKDVEKNRLVVGVREQLMKDEIVVDHLHWINQMTNSELQMLNDIRVRIRHGGRLVRAEFKNQKSKIKKTDQKSRNNYASLDSSPEAQNDRIKVHLAEKVFGVAPGQACVFYQDEVVLGGGVIVA